MVEVVLGFVGGIVAGVCISYLIYADIVEGKDAKIGRAEEESKKWYKTYVDLMIDNLKNKVVSTGHQVDVIKMEKRYPAELIMHDERINAEWIRRDMIRTLMDSKEMDLYIDYRAEKDIRYFDYRVSAWMRVVRKD